MNKLPWKMPLFIYSQQWQSPEQGKWSFLSVCLNSVTCKTLECSSHQELVYWISDVVLLDIKLISTFNQFPCKLNLAKHLNQKKKKSRCGNSKDLEYFSSHVVKKKSHFSISFPMPELLHHATSSQKSTIVSKTLFAILILQFFIYCHVDPCY